MTKPAQPEVRRRHRQTDTFFLTLSRCFPRHPRSKPAAAPFPRGTPGVVGGGVGCARQGGTVVVGRGVSVPALMMAMKQK